MRRMAIDTTQMAFGNGVMTRQAELPTHISMTLKTKIVRCPRRRVGQPGTETISRQASRGRAEGRLDLAAGVGVQAAGAVAGFATNIERIGSPGHQPGVVGGGEFLVEFIVALFAFLGADVFGARNIRQSDYGAVNTGTGNGKHDESRHQASESEGPANWEPRLGARFQGRQGCRLVTHVIGSWPCQ